MDVAKQCILQNNLEPAFKMLSRVSRIQHQLIQSWDVLSTLTPSEYMEFREKLGRSSGFQSYQNRLIEFTLGHKNARVLTVYQHQPELYQRLNETLHAPSLYDASIMALSKRGLPVDADANVVNGIGRNLVKVRERAHRIRGDARFRPAPAVEGDLPGTAQGGLQPLKLKGLDPLPGPEPHVVEIAGRRLILRNEPLPVDGFVIVRNVGHPMHPLIAYTGRNVSARIQTTP